MELGIKGRAEVTVTREKTAAAVGSGALEVFSTPDMICLMEKAALESVQPYLEEGQGTVGVRLEVSHLAAVPVGTRVWAQTELTQIDRRMLTFKVSAYSEKELIGEGIHKRCIVLSERFIEKMKAKY